MLVMSNGGFGGIHQRLLDRSRGRRLPRDFVPARLPLVAGLAQGVLLQQTVQAHGRAAEYRCPQLPASPRRAIDDVLRLLDAWPARDVALIGSSLGGYYATWLAERLGCRAVLLNPAIRPQDDLARHLGAQPVYFSDARSTSGRNT